MHLFLVAETETAPRTFMPELEKMCEELEESAAEQLMVDGSAVGASTSSVSEWIQTG